MHVLAGPDVGGGHADDVAVLVHEGPGGQVAQGDLVAARDVVDRDDVVDGRPARQRFQCDGDVVVGTEVQDAGLLYGGRS